MATLNEHGLLDPGVRPMTLDEVADLFGRFRRSDRRPRLMERLRAFVAEVRATDPRIVIHVDGSFVMGCVDEPDDVDVALSLPADWDVGASRRPFEYNATSPRMVRRLYRFDLLLGVIGQPSEAANLEFFSRVKALRATSLGLPPGTLKGIVRIGP